MSELRETLRALALCDQHTLDLARERAQIPDAIAKAGANAQAARDLIASERSALENAEHTRRSKEAEVADCEAKREKFQSQAPMVKTNAEYTALLHEIDGMTQRISQIEEEILLAMEEADRIGARIQDVEKEQTEAEQGFLREAKKLAARLEEVEKESELRQQEREELLSRLDPKARSHYQRIRAAPGTGVAWVQGGSCAACHRQVPPERINRVIGGELSGSANTALAISTRLRIPKDKCLG